MTFTINVKPSPKLKIIHEVDQDAFESFKWFVIYNGIFFLAYADVGTLKNIDLCDIGPEVRESLAVIFNSSDLVRSCIIPPCTMHKHFYMVVQSGGEAQDTPGAHRVIRRPDRNPLPPVTVEDDIFIPWTTHVQRNGPNASIHKHFRKLFRLMDRTLTMFYVARIQQLRKRLVDDDLELRFDELTDTLEAYHAVSEYRLIKKWSAAKELSSLVSAVEVRAMKARKEAATLKSATTHLGDASSETDLWRALNPYLLASLSEDPDPEFAGMYRILEHVDRETHKFSLGFSGLVAAVVGGLVGALVYAVLAALVS